MLFGPPVIAAILAYLATFLLQPKYESYATYYFPLNAPITGLAQLGGIQPSDKGSIGGLNGALSSPLIGSAPQTAIGIFASRTCRSMVLQDLRSKGKEVPDLDEKTLEDLTDTKVDRNGLVRLSVITENPELSQTIVTSYQKAFEEIAQKLTLNVSRRNRILLEERLKVLNAKAEKLQRLSLEAVASPSAIDMDLASDAMLEAEKLKIEASQKRAGIEAKLKSLIATLVKIYDSAAKNPGLASSEASPVLKALEERRLVFEDTRKAFQPGSAEMERAEKDYLTASSLIKDLSRDRRALAAAGIDPQTAEAVSEYAGLRAAERELNKQINGLKQRARQSASGVNTLDGLKAELAQTRKTISQLDSEYQLALVAEARDPARFEVLDEPQKEQKPVFPRRMLIAAMAGALVFALIAGRLAWRSVKRQEAEIR